MKPLLIHIIYNLGRGGAETMLVNTIPALPQYKHVVITLQPENHFGELDGVDQLHCLHLKSRFHFPEAIIKLKRLVARLAPDLVHSHLYWPTMLARLSVPARIPLLSTIHAFVKSSVEYRRSYIRQFDRLTYRFRDSGIIAVAEGARHEYFAMLNLPPKNSKTVYTFVDPTRFRPGLLATKREAHKPFKLVSVGALRTQKNYPFLIQLMAGFSGTAVTLDIYGEGNLRESLTRQIRETGAPIQLMGEVSNIAERLINYDGFVMSSSYEGFSLGVLEAMAAGVPLFLSDIASFREQAATTASYFSLTDLLQAQRALQEFIQHDSQRQKKRDEALTRVLEQFTFARYLNELTTVYDQVLSGKSLDEL